MSSSIDRSRGRLKRIYDDYRTVHMSREYYACRLALLKRWNLAYDIILAVGASGVGASGTVVSWQLLQTPVGKTSWALFAGLVAIMSILKPILQIPEKIERYSKLHTGYCDLFYDFRELVENVNSTGGITQEMTDSLDRTRKRYRDLALQDEVKPNIKLLRKCQSEVNRKTPLFDEWCPKTD